ncbi:putative secreted protein (Por secretion system target) [Larkinella arboricola]|uniref:Putative secreted protein (Por secretion system target) n=1 Tax=Larkinella arboricola TaxID=643671 RepID=A0A327WHW1_LARAB|nr:S8 family serine peptidase [Larkinella arboricola]RAJ90878.1 putative secreted protein (Por secretion system target) [Larkinella arboricola]
MTKSLHTWWVGGLAVLFLLGAHERTMAQIPDKQAAQEAKITPDLLALQRGRMPGIAGLAGDLQKMDLFQFSDNRIALEAMAAPGWTGQALLDQLQQLGLTEGVVYKELIFGYLPIDKLGALREIVALHVARPAYKPQLTLGAVHSQGDRAMRADVGRQNFGVTGAGVKVGVLSDSFNALGGAPKGVASGDLPNVEVIDDYFATTASDEGRAMAEIIHDVAPGAAIAFHTAFKGQAGFAKGIRDLAAAGCQIITDDVYYSNEPFFQDGIISQAIREVVTNKQVTYFTSAGNNERSSYQSSFRSGGLLVDPFYGPLGFAHDFGGGDLFQRVTIPANGRIILDFQWDDQFYSVNRGAGARTDMDLLVYYRGILQWNLSSYAVNRGNDPVELISLVNNTSAPVDIEVVLVKASGPDPTLIKWVNLNSSPLQIEHDTKSSSNIGHSNEATAITVGAAAYYQTPAFDATLPTAVIESFSSAGGTPVLFDPAGNRIPSEVRQKPEIVAPDGGNNTFFGRDVERDGWPNFFGTSASAPHAAAVGALLQEKARNTLSRQSLLSILQQTAMDMDDPLTPAFDTGFDFRTGYGLIQADKALQQVSDLFPQAVQRISLINAHTDKPIRELKTGEEINLAGLPTRNLAIGATTDPAIVGSVVLELSGQQSRTQIENVAPYALFEDNNGDYKGWKPEVGSYTLTATPYTGPDGTGAAGTPYTVSFTVVDHLKTVSFTLIDAVNQQPIQQITDGQVLDLASLPSPMFNIRATTNPDTVASVVLQLDGSQTRTQVENNAPYALFKDDGTGNYRTWKPALGSYTLTATPYPGRDGTGPAGIPLTISFQFVNSKSSPAARLTAETELNTGSIRVFPNPFAESFTLQTKGVGQSPVAIFDAYGRRVWQSRAAQPEQVIRLGNGLAPGLYLLQVGEGPTMQRYKLMKTH